MKRFVKEYAKFEESRIMGIENLPSKYVHRTLDEIDKVCESYEKGFLNETEAISKINTLVFEKPCCIGEPVTFYTGGGIWVTAMHSNHYGGYYAISNDEECLTYLTDGFDGGEEFPFYEMAWSKHYKELNEEQLAIYRKLQHNMAEKVDI